MRKDHVSVSRGVVTFDYIAKSGKQRVQSLVEPEVGAVVQALKRRRGGGEELLAYRDGDRWVDVKSADINAHLRALTGGEFTAKDFRTWSATVLAAVGLAVSHDAGSVTARKRAVSRVVQEVAHYLGNTPAVCRSSYIDPRVIDLYDSGITIEKDLKLLGDGASYGQPATQGRIEAALLRLLRTADAQALAG
jgi:DNA topoisomerase IB